MAITVTLTKNGQNGATADVFSGSWAVSNDDPANAPNVNVIILTLKSDDGTTSLQIKGPRDIVKGYMREIYQGI